METIQKKTLEYLPNVVDALKKDVPKKDYTRLQKGVIQRASAELGVILSRINGANKDNVKRLRQCLTHAHRREWEDLHNEEMLEEALIEYDVLRRTFFTVFGEKQRIVEALKGSEYRAPVPGKWQRIEQQYSTDTETPLTGRTPRTARGTTQLKDGRKTTMTKGRDSVSTYQYDAPLTDRSLQLTTRREKYDAYFLHDKNEPLATFLPENLGSMSPILDDPMRKQIAIQFRQLYDHYRAAAFDDLVMIGAIMDDAAVKLLVEILKGAHDFCKRVAMRQLDNMLEALENCVVSPPGQVKREGVKRKTSDVEIPPYMMKEALRMCKHLRKQACRVSITKIKKEYFMQPITDILPTRTEHIINYVHKCAEVTWLMVVQEPQMTFYWPEEGEMRPEMFKVYPGSAVFDEFCVWPALLQCHNGPVCVKGYIQPYAPDLPMPPRKAPKSPDQSPRMEEDIDYGTPMPASPMSEESINIT